MKKVLAVLISAILVICIIPSVAFALTDAEMEELYNTGLDYYFGDGVNQNYEKAFELLMKSAESGHSGAMRMIGMMYLAGDVVDTNYCKAFEWTEKAAEKGNTTAMYDLGVLYDYGYGVQQNFSKAEEWYTKAAEAGVEEAIEYLKGSSQKPIEELYKK